MLQSEFPTAFGETLVVGCQSINEVSRISDCAPGHAGTIGFTGAGLKFDM